MQISQKGCFVLSPIGASGSETRVRSDLVFSELISPVLGEFDYRGVRADHIDAPGLITNQMIAYLAESPIVIADLTDHNPNVFYELAIRHALHKPVIQIIATGQQIPFAVAGTRTIYFEITTESGKHEARTGLRATAFNILSFHKPRDSRWFGR